MKLSKLSPIPLYTLAILAVMLPSWPSHSQDKGAGDFLVSISEEAVSQLTENGLSEEEKEQRFRMLMNKAFDIPRISKFILGVNWRRATPEQRQEFIEVFEETNTQRFLPLFAEYAGDRIQVVRERQDSNNKKLYFVTTKLVREQGDPINVEWRIRNIDEQFKILDASAEGVSIALSLRQEYGSVVQSSGIEGLIDELKRKAAGQPTSSATANN